MNINWSALGEVVAVGLAVTVAVVAVFSLGVRANASGAVASRVASLACFAACGAAVLYGLYLVSGY